MELQLRRIVTGHDARGRSVFAEDKTRPMAGFLHEHWVTQATPAKTGGAPDLGSLPTNLEPPPRGTIVRYVQFQPTQGMSHSELEAMYAPVFKAIGAAHTRVDTSRHPAMHKTSSLDYGIVLQGEITLLLDEGERHLKPFDICIQRGTNHGWVNRGSAPCLMAFILIDGEA
jgi:hypothetical protein